MEFIETPLFTKLVAKYMPDDSFRKLQQALMEAPDMGVIIEGSGGIRKLRWEWGEKGKRGGLRIIYYWITRYDQIYLLYLYPKNRADDLTADQIHELRIAVETELKTRK